MSLQELMVDPAKIAKIAATIGFPFLVFFLSLLPMRTARYGDWIRARPKMQQAHIAVSLLAGLAAMAIAHYLNSN